MQLTVLPLRFLFLAREPISFATGAAANHFRGALGLSLRQAFCDPSCPGVHACPRERNCAYARLFDPALATGPSGLRNPPRPFVLRAAALDAKSFSPGETFALDVNIFDPHVPALGWFENAFSVLSREGLGPQRSRAELIESQSLAPIALGFEPHPQPVSQLRIRFLTPTGLKGEGMLAGTPRFDLLFRRTRDRVSSLAALYQGQQPAFDFCALAERAAKVELTRSHLSHVCPERRSTRTGQTHWLGGFTGWADYEGDLSPFLPFLEAAYWTGVGRFTSWGNGWIAASTSRPPD